MLTSDLHEEKCLYRADIFEEKVDKIQTQLTIKIGEISNLIQLMVQFMMGNGAVSLSKSFF